MSETKVKIACHECKGTGIYSGMFEPKGTGVICTACKGSGAQEHPAFTGRSKTRDYLVITPNANSNIGTLVQTTALDQDVHGLSWAEIAAQRWGVEGTVYDERPGTFGGLLYLVGHADGPPVWYGQTELEYLK